MSTIRGHCGQIKIFKDGEVQEIINVTNITINQDSTFLKSHFVGQPLPVGDQSHDGWSGSIDTEVSGDQVDRFIDALVTNNLLGIGMSDYSFVTTENYPDGRSSSYLYFDCFFKMSRVNPGQTAKMTKKLDFQASGRKAL